MHPPNQSEDFYDCGALCCCEGVRDDELNRVDGCREKSSNDTDQSLDGSYTTYTHLDSSLDTSSQYSWSDWDDQHNHRYLYANYQPIDLYSINKINSQRIRESTTMSRLSEDNKSDNHNENDDRSRKPSSFTKASQFFDTADGPHHKNYLESDKTESFAGREIPKEASSLLGSHHLGEQGSATHNEVESASYNIYNEEEPLTFLVEIVATDLPNRLTACGQPDESRGMHCTVYWVGPDPSYSSSKTRFLDQNKRKEVLMHRTKTLKIGRERSTAANELKPSSPDSRNAPDKATKTGLSINAEEGAFIEEFRTGHIFTIDDGSLFLFKTTMKQLADASPCSILSSPPVLSSSDEEDSKAKISSDHYQDVLNSGGLRFDVFEKPLDAFSTVCRNVTLASISEKEACATSYDSALSLSPTSGARYRLLGSAFLTPQDILVKCDEERFECDLVDHWRKRHRQRQKPQLHKGTSLRHQTWNDQIVVNGKLALRIRLATKLDVEFVKSLIGTESPKSIDNIVSFMSNSNYGSKVATDESNDVPGTPVELTTEIDENILAAQTSIKAISNMAPVAHESVRYLFSNDFEKRIFVKPYQDPSCPEETMWFTESELKEVCYTKPSKKWIQAGSGSLGKVWLEILECRGLPNVDAGGSLGNKTDAFVSIVYGDVMVQTDIIDDCCSPMWMPWTQRAFIFKMSHPSTAMYIGVADYDVGPVEHECIGRVAISVGRFSPGFVYTLTYKLHESTNLTDLGEDAGTITVRLRVDYDETKFLMTGWKTPDPQWVNSRQWKTHRVAKFCCDGPHDYDIFEMRLFRSHINEILTQKRTLVYVVSDAISSLIFWRGQVKIGNLWLPLHSALAFFLAVHTVENPQLLPSMLFFSCGWILTAGMMKRECNPNPWQRGHSFYDYWNVLVKGESLRMRREIKPYQGHKESVNYEKVWTDRLEEDNARFAKQAELDAKLADISNDSIIRTKAKANGPLSDPISSVAGGWLLPYQQRLSRICIKIRFVRNILNWNESVVSFWLTVACFILCFISLFLPWAFIFRWISRLIVWIFLGPWMKFMDVFLYGVADSTSKEERAKHRQIAFQTLLKSFQEQSKMAKTLRENVLKMKAFRVRLFGKYITKLPEYNLTRHEDIPLPESSAVPFDDDNKITTDLFISGQNLCGVMVPTIGKKPKTEKIKLEEKNHLLSRLKKQIHNRDKETEYLPIDEGLDEGIELIDASPSALSRDISVKGESLGDTKMNVICLSSSNSSGHATSLVPCEKLKDDHYSDINRSNSSREIVISDNAIQAALENQVKEKYEKEEKQKPRSRWVLSASISVSIKKETVFDTLLLDENEKATIRDDETNNLHIQSETEVAEEGVEVVPLLTNDDNGDDHDMKNTEMESSCNERVSVIHIREQAESIYVLG